MRQDRTLIQTLRGWLGGCLMLLCIPVWATTVQIKPDAPQEYVVKKGDTLWDIAGMFLHSPWKWPELWRQNLQVVNPHLIYPGDILRLSFNEKGEPVIEISRTPKARLTLSPSGRVKQKAVPVKLLPWDSMAPHIQDAIVVEASAYADSPRILGDQMASLRFVEDEWVLSSDKGVAGKQALVRKVQRVHDADGNALGVHLQKVGDIHPDSISSEAGELVKISLTDVGARQGDRIMPWTDLAAADMRLASATSQQGQIIASAERRKLIGKFDVVILDLGSAEVSPGTVMGVYAKGPRIKTGDQPEYVRGQFDFTLWEGEVAFPAVKVGEVVVYRAFNRASLALVVDATAIIQRGAVVARP